MAHCFCHFFFIIVLINFFELNTQPVTGTTKLTAQDVFNAFPDGTANAETKNNLPLACQKGASHSWTSFIKTATPPVTHPSGATLFADDATLGRLLTTFLTNLDQDDTTRAFTVYFTRIHLLILHQLYMYLTKIYVVFNMTHIDTIQNYLTQDAQQALNKKTLIINHLINIIEAQSNGAMRARFPTLPAHLATYAGNVLMRHDYGADLTVMLDKSEVALVTDKNLQELIKPTIGRLRDSYLALFGDYLLFFNQYTQTLNQQNTTRGYVGINSFAQHAQHIAQLMQQYSPPINSSLSMQEQITTLRSLKKLNPPMFFYDAETMRGLKIIPLLAQSIPKNVQNVPWPAKLVEDANNQVRYQPKFGPQTDMLLAFFENNRLYVNIPTLQYQYTQELLPQPDWLNSVDGVMKMLQACVGNFAALLDPIFAQEDILDPCLECIVRNAAVKAGIVTAPGGVSCTACTAFINGIAAQLAAEASDNQPPPLVVPGGGPLTPPNISGGPPPPGGNP
jgi:hypothetical protein